MISMQNLCSVQARAYKHQRHYKCQRCELGPGTNDIRIHNSTIKLNKHGTVHKER